MKNKQGVALLMALFALIYIALLGAAYVDMVTIDRQIVTNHLWDIRSLYIADAGIEHAIYDLKQGGNGDIPRTEFPDTSDNYTYYTVEFIKKKGNLTTVESTSEIYQSQRTIRAEIAVSGANARVEAWQEVE